MGNLFNLLPPYLSPTNDIAFRRIFGNREKTFILISFLNHILNLPEDRKIREVEILDPQQVPHLDGMKESIVDVKCVDQRGVKYIVEMQVANKYNSRKRTLFYTSYTYVNQLNQGDDYPELNDVIFLGILGFNLTQNPHYVSTHRIHDESTREIVLDDFRFTFVELPKFELQEKDLQTVSEKWIFFLKNAAKLDHIPENIHEPEITEAFELLQRHGWKPDEMESYYARGMNQRDEYEREKKIREEAQKQGKEEGRREGVKEGMKEGMKEGIQKGVEKERLNIARKMLQIVTAEEVAQITGLSLEEIKRIK